MKLHATSTVVALAVSLSCSPIFSAETVAPPDQTPVVVRGKTYNFPVYTNQPLGRQVSGQHAPAKTPALSPEAAQKKFAVPAGFEVRLFAAEPEVVNPVAMTWDERGRLWVVELYEYPMGAKPGQKPRDRIKILEDTDADGRADSVKVFADGFNLATGLLLGNDGVYLGQAPHFLFLEDTNSDDIADRKTVLKSGFGMEDRHELLNSFTWGPDGWLYMTHGVFTHSKVRNPDDPNDDGVIMNAAVARYHTRTKKFEVFADGTSNPWGVDFDRTGNAFVSACVIDHLFHMAPGGHYARQAGAPANPFGYQLLPSIVDHKHHMAAYAGVQVYQGNQYPSDYLGTILMGNIHDNAIHQDRLTPNGSSFKASFIKDFVRANDGWFMPVSSQIGPDGALWMMDWYDRYPCYQNANADPNGVDREYGRIWRVVHFGDKPGAPVSSRPNKDMDLKRLNLDQLAELLAHPNVWQRRTVQRLLSERLHKMGRTITPPRILALIKDGPTLESRLAALWTLHGADRLTEEQLDQLVTDKDPGIRTWIARLTGERQNGAESVLQRLETLASDDDPSVRLAVATAARQFASGSLTINTPVAAALADVQVGPILAPLVAKSADGKDPLIPFMIWLAGEPRLAQDPLLALDWLREHGAESMPLTGTLAAKAMRRICDLSESRYLVGAVEFIGGIADKSPEMAIAAIDGLMEGQKGKALVPAMDTRDFLARLSAHPNKTLAARGQQLGTLWGDSAAIQKTLAVLANSGASVEERRKAISSLKSLKNDLARESLLKLVSGEPNETLVIDSIRVLSEMGGDQVADQLLKNWPRFSPSVRRTAADTLVSRWQWRNALLGALEKNSISAGDLPTTVIRSLVQSRDDYVRERASKAIRFREADADKLKLIAVKRAVVLEGPIDLKQGHEATRKACLTCHKLHGEGAEVGPDLTGVGRSSLDALLANVIDPNQIIGKGYENVEVETKDGRTVSGRLMEDTDTRVRLLSVGPKEDVIARSDIASMRVSEVSVMPEGLEQMPDAEFRSMIWYILNPPQDNRPMTPARRQELIGEERPAAQTGAFPDGESVALWNPAWRVSSEASESTPVKLPEYAGRKNVLMTHPFSQQRAAALERTIDLPKGSRTALLFRVAADEQGDWELRAFIDGKLVHKQLVDRAGERWKKVQIDLSPYAGRTVTVRLENCANDWEWEFGYWSDIELASGPDQHRASRQ